MITEKQFKRYLLLYGAAVEDWPEDIRGEALRMSCDIRISALVMRHGYFEEVLRRSDPALPENPRLADRIVAAAGRRSQGIGIAAKLQDLLAAVLPQPAFALAAVLTLGIVIGFSLPAQSGGDNFNPIYNDEAAL